MKFGHLLGLGAIDAFSDMEKTSIGIPKIGTDVTMKCEGLHLSFANFSLNSSETVEIRTAKKSLITKLRAALRLKATAYLCIKHTR